MLAYLNCCWNARVSGVSYRELSAASAIRLPTRSSCRGTAGRSSPCTIFMHFAASITLITTRIRLASVKSAYARRRGFWGVRVRPAWRDGTRPEGIRLSTSRVSNSFHPPTYQSTTGWPRMTSTNARHNIVYTLTKYIYISYFVK